MKKLLLLGVFVSAVLAWAFLNGCAELLKGAACSNPPYIWDAAREVCHDHDGAEAAPACCDRDKQPVPLPTPGRSR